MSIYLTVLESEYPISEFPADVILPKRSDISRDKQIDPEYPTARFLSKAYFSIELVGSHIWGDEEIYDQLKNQGVEVAKEDHRPPPIFGDLGALNLLMQAGPAVTAAIGVVIGAWLQQKGNHKVRLKIGDKEMEARDVAELQEVLDVATKFQENTERANADEQQMISELAYELWVKRGRPNDSPEADWNRAEELIRRFRGKKT